MISQKNSSNSFLSKVIASLTDVLTPEELSFSPVRLSRLNAERATYLLQRHVVKIHPTYINREILDQKFRLIASKPCRDLFLQPLQNELVSVDERSVSIWPLAKSLSAESPEQLDWSEYGRLLGKLHEASSELKTAMPQNLCASSWPSRVRRGLERTKQCKENHLKHEVLKAYSRLAVDKLCQEHVKYPTIVHGDWHPGQMVLFQNKTLFIDVDDIGMGNFSWDLSRPAAWFYCGLLDESLWNLFLTNYISTSPIKFHEKTNHDDLEAAARAAVVQGAASALVQSELENRKLNESEELLLSCCSRINQYFKRKEFL